MYQKLLQTQKNRILQFIVNQSFNPNNFTWVEKDSMLEKSKKVITSTSLIFIPKKSFFYKFNVYDINMGQWLCKFSPGEESNIDEWSVSAWNDHEYYFIRWLSYLKREINAPDLWKEIVKYKPTFSLTPPKELVNDPIPVNEVNEIIKSLKEIETKINKEFNLSLQHQKFVESRFEYLEDAVRRQGRLDWFHTVIGVFTSITLFLKQNPEESRKLWELVKSLFVYVFSLVS